MHTTYGMDTCIETNEILAFGIMMEVYSRYIPGICKNLEYVRHIPDILRLVCLTYDTIQIPDGLLMILFKLAKSICHQSHGRDIP